MYAEKNKNPGLVLGIRESAKKKRTWRLYLGDSIHVDFYRENEFRSVKVVNQGAVSKFGGIETNLGAKVFNISIGEIELTLHQSRGNYRVHVCAPPNINIWRETITEEEELIVA